MMERKEKPILFSGEMVKAILEGRKTQTRRVIKPQGKLKKVYGVQGDYLITNQVFRNGQPGIKMPYKEGDLLYVREKFNAKSLTGKWWHEVPREERPLHNWAYTNPVCPAYTMQPPRWLPSIHMPKDATRIWLEIADISVERVQHIAPYDIPAEGVSAYGGSLAPVDHWEAAWRELWDSINAKRGFGWDVNPWVWAITFKVVDHA